MKRPESYVIQRQLDPETWIDEYADLEEKEAKTLLNELRKEYGASMEIRMVKRTWLDEVVDL